MSLRFDACSRPHASQDSLSVDGQSLPNGVRTRQVSKAVSRRVMTLPRPQASCRNHGSQVKLIPFVVLNVAVEQHRTASRELQAERSAP